MPASAAHIAVVGKASLENYLRNPPVDQIKTGRPWIRKLRMRKKTFAGGKEHVVVQIRKDYDENGQWYYGEQAMTFNKRDTLEQAFYKWTGFRDGYTMTTDEFIENGLSISQDSRVSMTGAEKVQLTNLFTERNEALVEGFEKQLDQGFHRAGSAGGDAIRGLDHLIGATVASASAGKVGNLDRATYSWWRPTIKTGLTKANLENEMELGFQSCQRNGGMPDYIMMGTDALNVYRQTAVENVERRVDVGTGGAQPKMGLGVGENVDGGVMTGLFFKGLVPIVWDPVALDIDALESATNKWEKRIYMLNCRTIQEMPVRGFDEVSYVPPTVYNREAHFFGRRWKGALIMNRANANWMGVVS